MHQRESAWLYARRGAGVVASQNNGRPLDWRGPVRSEGCRRRWQRWLGRIAILARNSDPKSGYQAPMISRWRVTARSRIWSCRSSIRTSHRFSTRRSKQDAADRTSNMTPDFFGSSPKRAVDVRPFSPRLIIALTSRKQIGTRSRPLRRFSSRSPKTYERPSIFSARWW